MKHIRKFLFEVFHSQLQYHAYASGNAGGFAGWYTLCGKTIAYQAQDERVGYPFFSW